MNITKLISRKIKKKKENLMENKEIINVKSNNDVSWWNNNAKLISNIYIYMINVPFNKGIFSDFLKVANMPIHKKTIP